jgi:hypothetical protein
MNKRDEIEKRIAEHRNRIAVAECALWQLRIELEELERSRHLAPGLAGEARIQPRTDRKRRKAK